QPSSFLIVVTSLSTPSPYTTLFRSKVSVKFFNSKTTFEIPLSFTEIQVKESFSSAEQLNGFLTMLTTSIENSMTVKLDGLIMRTINNMIGDTLLNDKDGVKAEIGRASCRERV